MYASMAIRNFMSEILVQSYTNTIQLQTNVHLSLAGVRNY